MRFVCFHGRGTNAQFFETQTAELRQAIGSRHDFVFVEGPFEASPAPGSGLSPETGRRWSTEQPQSRDAEYQRIYRDLVQFITTRGPFDGVMGFSEGAAVAATLLIADSQSHFANFKCGLFFCGAAPQHLDALQGEDIRLMDASPDRLVIQVPTAHVWSDKGGMHPGMGRDLAYLCKEAVRIECIHELGHDVPRGRSDTGFREALRAMERTIERGKNQ